MGPMIRGRKLDKRRVTKLGALGMVAMFAWSFIAAPASISQVEPAAEPDEIIAYSTFAEAAPVSSYLDHKSPVPAPAFGIALAHSLTEVNQPSQASALAWLTDFGIANGLHGTTTGSAVPTEASARQPGGAPTAEFRAAGGPIGEEEFGRASAGVARTSATQQGSPRGFANSYLGNLVLFPAAGTPPEPPGTYDPGDTFPGGPELAPTPDPGPRSQMAILSVGSIASTSESVRNGETVTSIGVAELQGINIGNRTSDNRCTNCFTIDAIRVETFAQTNGTKSKAGYRVMLGRACRRALVATGEEGGGFPREEDTCLPLQDLGQGDPNAPETGGLHAMDTAAFNDFFSEPVVLSGLTCPGSNLPCTIALRITAGEVGHADPRRPERTVNPPDSACRNYAYPDPDPKAKPVAGCEELPESLRPKTGPDQDNGQEAKAVAEGIDIEILTLTGTQLVPVNADLDACFGVFDNVNGVVGQLPLQEVPAPPAPLPDLASTVGTLTELSRCRPPADPRSQPDARRRPVRSDRASEHPGRSPADGRRRPDRRWSHRWSDRRWPDPRWSDRRRRRARDGRRWWRRSRLREVRAEDRLEVVQDPAVEGRRHGEGHPYRRHLRDDGLADPPAFTFGRGVEVRRKWRRPALRGRPLV